MGMRGARHRLLTAQVSTAWELPKPATCRNRRFNFQIVADHPCSKTMVRAPGLRIVWSEDAEYADDAYALVDCAFNATGQVTAENTQKFPPPHVLPSR